MGQTDRRTYGLQHLVRPPIEDRTITDVHFHLPKPCMENGPAARYLVVPLAACKNGLEYKPKRTQLASNALFMYFGTA